MHPGADMSLTTSTPGLLPHILVVNASCLGTRPETTEGPWWDVRGPRGSPVPIAICAPSHSCTRTRVSAQPNHPPFHTLPAPTPAQASVPDKRNEAATPSQATRRPRSPFIPRLEFGQQGGPPPLGLDDGARRQVWGVVTGVVLVLEQPDILQREAQEVSEQSQPTPQSRAQGTESHAPCPVLASAPGHGPRSGGPVWPEGVPRADRQLTCTRWGTAWVPHSPPPRHPELCGYALFPKETAESPCPHTAGKATARASANRALREQGMCARRRRQRRPGRLKASLGFPGLVGVSHTEARIKVRRINCRQNPPSSGKCPYCP